MRIEVHIYNDDGRDGHTVWANELGPESAVDREAMTVALHGLSTVAVNGQFGHEHTVIDAEPLALEGVAPDAGSTGFADIPRACAEVIARSEFEEMHMGELLSGTTLPWSVEHPLHGTYFRSGLRRVNALAAAGLLPTVDRRRATGPEPLGGAE